MSRADLMACCDVDPARLAAFADRHGMAYSFGATLLGSAGSAHIEIADSAGFYREMLVRLIDMVRTGVMPIPPASTLEIIRILDAAHRSQATGEVVRL